MKENQSIRLFISYGRDEYMELADQLKNDLFLKGFQIWFDKDRLKEGVDWESYIENGLDWLAEDKENSFMIFLMTPHSVRRPDGFCLNELAKAILKNIPIIPLMVVQCEPPLSICRLQWLDMQDCLPMNLRYESYKRKFEKLLSGLESRSFEYDDEQKDLLRLLSPVDNSQEIFRHLKKFSGRKWLMEIIENWFQNAGKDDKIFWITGLPGIGKSAIAAWLCEHQKQISAVHFCEFGNQEKTDLVRMVKSLAYQLSTQLSDYAHALNALDIRETFSSYTNPKTLFNILITRILNRISSPDHAIAILIDALDEATKDGRNELAELIVTEFEKTPPWLKLVITSRPDPEVIVPLQKLSPFTIDASCQDNITDIKDYLDAELSVLLVNLNPSQRKDIIEKISLKSEGIFLYVKSVCEELKAGRLKLENIDQFPKSLGTIYNIFFQREFPDNINYKQNAREAISLIISSYEPLKIRLLKEMLGWNEGDFNDFVQSLGSLFIIKEIDLESSLYVYHLSLIDWITDRLKSGDFCIPLNDGRLKFVKFGWEQYEKFKSNPELIPDLYYVKWLPTLLFDTERYDQALALLTDENYVNLKINYNFDDILFQDFKKLFYQADKIKDIKNYHKILIHNIKAHIQINNSSLVRFESCLKEGVYESILQAIDLTDHFKGKELFLSYMILLVHLINNSQLDNLKRAELVQIILKNIGRHFLSDTHFNALDHLPKNLIDHICYKLEIIGISSKVISTCCDTKSNNPDKSNSIISFESFHVDLLKNEKKENNFVLLLKLAGELLLYILLNFIYFFNYALYYMSAFILDSSVKACIFITYLFQTIFKQRSYSRRYLSELYEKFVYPRIIRLFFRTSVRIGVTYKGFLRNRDLRNYIPANGNIITRLLSYLILSKRERLYFGTRLLLYQSFQLTDQQINKRVDSLIRNLDRLHDKYYVRYDKIGITEIITESLVKSGLDKFIIPWYERRLEYINRIGLQQFRQKHWRFFLEELTRHEANNDLLIKVLLAGYNTTSIINDKFMKLLAITNFKEWCLNTGRIDKIQDSIIDSIEDRAWVRNFPGRYEPFSVRPDWSLVFPEIGNYHGYKSYEVLNCFIDNYEGVRAEDPSIYFPELAGMYNNSSESEIEFNVYKYLVNESEVKETIAQSKSLLRQISDAGEKDKVLESLACAYAGSGMVSEIEHCLASFTDVTYYSNTACLVSEILRKKEDQELSEKYLKTAYDSAIEIKNSNSVKKKVLKYYLIRRLKQDPQESIRLLFQITEQKLIDVGDRNEILKLIYEQLIKKREETTIQELINVYPSSLEVLKRILLYGSTEEISQELIDQCQVFNKFFFRKIDQIEENIFRFTAEKVTDLEYLLNIIYRYSAYMAFVCKREVRFRKTALAAMNEVVSINDWMKAMK